jgi:hypothetical protein
MTDDEIFDNWWRTHAPPGTFDKDQCRIAFIAGMTAESVRDVQAAPQQPACNCPAKDVLHYKTCPASKVQQPAADAGAGDDELHTYAGVGFVITKDSSGYEYHLAYNEVKYFAHYLFKVDALVNAKALIDDLVSGRRQ